MSSSSKVSRILMRQGTEAEWIAYNKSELAPGEVAVELDTNRMKFGPNDSQRSLYKDIDYIAAGITDIQRADDSINGPNYGLDIDSKGKLSLDIIKLVDSIETNTDSIKGIADSVVGNRAAIIGNLNQIIKHADSIEAINDSLNAVIDSVSAVESGLINHLTDFQNYVDANDILFQGISDSLQDHDDSIKALQDSVAALDAESNHLELGVNGDLTSGSLIVHGPAAIDGTLIVDDNAAFGGGLEVAGPVTAGALASTTTLSVAGDASVSGGLGVTGQVSADALHAVASITGRSASLNDFDPNVHTPGQVFPFKATADVHVMTKAAFDDSIAGLIDSVTSLNDTVGGLLDTVIRMDTQVHYHDGLLASLNGEIDSIFARVDVLEDSVTTLDTDKLSIDGLTARTKTDDLVDGGTLNYDTGGAAGPRYVYRQSLPVYSIMDSVDAYLTSNYPGANDTQLAVAGFMKFKELVMATNIRKPATIPVEDLET